MADSDAPDPYVVWTTWGPVEVSGRNRVGKGT